jgi:hypothetical protein
VCAFLGPIHEIEQKLFDRWEGPNILSHGFEEFGRATALNGEYERSKTISFVIGYSLKMIQAASST